MQTKLRSILFLPLLTLLMPAAQDVNLNLDTQGAVETISVGSETPQQSLPSIARWMGNRQAAVSYTFDDGLQEHYTEVWPHLKKLGMKATFCVIGSKVGGKVKSSQDKKMGIDGTPCMTWSQLREMAKDGQEITSHGYEHKNTTKLSKKRLRYEVEHNDTLIRDSVGTMPRTYFYPGNAKNDITQAFCEQGRVGSRTTQISIGSKRDTTWLRNWIDRLMADGGWGVGMTHGINTGYDHFKDAETLWSHLRYANSQKERLWIATFHDVAAYEKERNAAKVSARKCGDGSMTVTLSNPLDSRLFNHPLTMILPKGMNIAWQDGHRLKVYEAGGNYCADVNPNGGEITLRSQPAWVILTAGQSNTDGRVVNDELPKRIKEQGYKCCRWSYGSGKTSGGGRFEPFWPRLAQQGKNDRWAYDAVVYYELEQQLRQPFYVIKESMGGTAIDTLCRSNSYMHWTADPGYLSRTAASDKGGRSLLKAFTENIAACIDSQLACLPEGYDIKFMMWHQGESDRRQADRYYENLKAVVNYVRQYLVSKTGRQKYARLSFICGTFSKKSKQGSQKVVDALLRLEQEDANFHVVDVSDASLQRDQIHFDAAGAELLGMRMMQEINKLQLEK